MYGGLTYQILGNPVANIYIIKTEMYADVAIYAGTDTVAQFPGVGHGEGESTDTVTPVEIVPTPTTQVSDPAPAEPTVASVVYARFPEAMSLVTKEGTQAVNFMSGTVVETYTNPTNFEAVGKATFPDNTTYYMSFHNFGEADTTQTTPITVGIKTGNLKPAAPEIISPPAPKPPEGVDAPVHITDLGISISTS